MWWKGIDEIYSASYYNFEDDNEDNNVDKKPIKLEERRKPHYIIIFIDEINRFIPKTLKEKIDAIPEQIMKTVIAGRSRGTV